MHAASFIFFCNTYALTHSLNIHLLNQNPAAEISALCLSSLCNIVKSAQALTLSGLANA